MAAGRRVAHRLADCAQRRDGPRRLSGQPGINPTGPDGEKLPVVCIAPSVLLYPGYVVLVPGQAARAQVGWGGWDGAEPSGDVAVDWPGGELVVAADGPSRPQDRSESGRNTWTSWFRLTD